MSLRLFTLIVATWVGVTSASAQAWQPFGVRQAGFVFDVPPDFTLEEVTNDGMQASFATPEDSTLTVWGDKLPRNEFEATIKAQLNNDEAAGWKYPTAELGPLGQVIPESKTARSVTSGQLQFATTALRSSNWIMTVRTNLRFDPVVTRMVKSLKAEGC